MSSDLKQLRGLAETKPTLAAGSRYQSDVRRIVLRLVGSPELPLSGDAAVVSRLEVGLGLLRQRMGDNHLVGRAIDGTSMLGAEAEVVQWLGDAIDPRGQQYLSLMGLVSRMRSMPTQWQSDQVARGYLAQAVGHDLNPDRLFEAGSLFGVDGVVAVARDCLVPVMRTVQNDQQRAAAMRAFVEYSPALATTTAALDARIKPSSPTAMRPPMKTMRPTLETKGDDDRLFGVASSPARELERIHRIVSGRAVSIGRSLLQLDVSRQTGIAVDATDLAWRAMVETLACVVLSQSLAPTTNGISAATERGAWVTIASGIAGKQSNWMGIVWDHARDDPARVTALPLDELGARVAMRAMHDDGVLVVDDQRLVASFARTWQRLVLADAASDAEVRDELIHGIAGATSSDGERIEKSLQRLVGEPHHAARDSRPERWTQR